MPRLASKITPCLWFDRQAEAAAKFYTSIFPQSRLGKVARYPEGGPGPAGQVMTVEFRLAGQDFIALNGGPQFKFTEAVSFVVNCTSQKEVDHYWDALRAGGGRSSRCGWLKDRFGLSWQIVPVAMNRLFTGRDKAGARRAMQAMLGMVKLDLEKLEEAYGKK